MKFTKRIISALLVCCVLLTLCACGSGNGQRTSPSADPENAGTQPELVYAAEHKPLGNMDEFLNCSPYCPIEDGFYVSYNEKVGEQIPDGVTPEYEGQYDTLEPRLAFLGYDGAVTRLENYAPLTSDTDSAGKRDFRSTESIEQLLRSDEGRLVVIESVYSAWLETPEDIKASDPDYYTYLSSDNSYYVRVLDSLGGELSCAKLQYDGEGYLNTYNSCLDNAGNIAIPTDSGVQAYNMVGEQVYSLDLGGYIYYAARMKDGRVAAMGWFGSGGMSLAVIDGEKKAADSAVIPMSYRVERLYSGSGEYDLYYTENSTLKGLKLDSGEVETLFNWLDCDLSGDQVSVLTAAEDGRFMGVSYQQEESFTVSKTPYDMLPQKTHLSLAAIYLDERAQEAVINFNRRSDTHRIDVVDYSQYNSAEDSSAGFTKLTTEIMAGNMPDIMCVPEELSFSRLAAKGLLEDLTPYIEADKEIKLSDIFPNVLDVLELDGKLCVIVPSFSVQTVAGAASVVGDTPGWTYDDYFAALEKMPEGCDGFGIGIDRHMILQVCVSLDMQDYVDWSTGQCRFDSEDFIRLLNFAASFPDAADENYPGGEEDSPEARIAAGKQMLYATGFGSLDFVTDDYDDMFGGKATFIGFPTNNGVGSVLYIDNNYVMSSTCKDKDAAWQFLRVFLTEDYQDEIYGIPTNMKSFEKQLTRAMEQDYEQDANGNYLLDENGERIPISRGMVYDGISYKEIYATTPEQARQIREAISTATRLMDYDSSIIDIVLEQAEPFFAGQKSAEETAKLIQSKANIYVNEQR